MKTVCVSIKILGPDNANPIGYTPINCHIVWNIKLDGFIQKARWVAGGHMTNVLAVNLYASIVLRETI